MRYKVLLAVLAGMFAYGSSSAQQNSSAIRAGAQMEDPEDVKAYDALSELPAMADRKVFFGAQSPARKAGVWRLHMRRYLRRNPDLSDKQKSAIENAIAFLTPDLYTIRQDDPEWQARVDTPIKQIRENLLRVLPEAMVRDLLFQLGERDTLTPERTNSPRGEQSPVTAPHLESRPNSLRFRSHLASERLPMLGSQAFLPQVRWTSLDGRVPLKPLLFQMPSCDCSDASDWCG